MSEAAAEAGTKLVRLLTQVGRGNRGAFEQLYDLTAPKLFGVAVRIIRERDRAEDVLQDSFVTIWQRAGDYDPVRGSVMSWLSMIVRNRAIDLQRRYVHRGDGRTESDDTLAEMAAGAFYDTDRGATLGALSRCMAQLDDLPRRAVLLAYAYGLTHEELAARMTTPIGTIKSWVRRSLDRLKKCLDG